MVVLVSEHLIWPCRTSLAQICVTLPSCHGLVLTAAGDQSDYVYEWNADLFE